MTPAELIDFEQKLKKNDWTYEMSDDSSAYSRGQSNDSDLRKLAKELGEDAVVMYNDYYERYSYPKGKPLR
jgi:hypothetical protein